MGGKQTLTQLGRPPDQPDHKIGQPNDAMDGSTSENLYDGLKFAKNLGKRGRSLTDKIRKLIDLRSRTSDFKNALITIRAAGRFLAEAEVQTAEEDDDLYIRAVLRGLNAQAVVLYCRGSDPGGGRAPFPRDKWLLTPEEKAKHANIKKVRDWVIAHHVQGKADIAGPWLTERMYFMTGKEGQGIGVELLRFDYKSATTWEIIEMATKAVERIWPIDAALTNEIAAELRELLLDQGNRDHLDHSRFDIALGHRAEDMKHGKTTYQEKWYPEKGSPWPLDGTPG
jgi:hypothetical protein